MIKFFLNPIALVICIAAAGTPVVFQKNILSENSSKFIIAQTCNREREKTCCEHDKRWYRVGERRGPYICSPDGKWERVS
jgi:hypothetical protein